MKPPRASTRVFALLGDPVRHSLSPSFQNAALEAAGVDAVYVALRCGAGEFSGLLRGIALAGGGGNVTLPHKERAVAALDDPSPAVLRTGACNTFWNEEGRVRGDNTDVEGFRRALLRLTGGDMVPRRVLVIGAGGAARAACAGLLELEVEEIRLRNRTVARAEALARGMGDDRVRVEGEGEGGCFDLVVNATRLGLEPDDPLPISPKELAGAGGVLDLVYAPRGATPLVQEANRLGVPADDGLEMLLQQGVAAFERWTGREAPVAVMRAALRRERPGEGTTERREAGAQKREDRG